jgi:hypothetical protein
MKLSKRTRLILLITGITLIIVSLVMLAFAFKTSESLRTRFTVAPTLLTPPPAQP